MQWNRSNAIGLARAACSFCNGQGTRIVRGKEDPCDCVFRAVFRACFNRFRECAALGSHANTVSYGPSSGPDGRRVYSRKREEYMADFDLISKRVLSGREYKIFRYHYLLGADCNLCSRQLKITRGEFFHLVYKIQERLGRAFAETQPYGLFPLREYFGGVVERYRPALATAPAEPRISRRRIRPEVAMGSMRELQRIA